MVLGPEWQLKCRKLIARRRAKGRKLFQHKMVKLNSLKKATTLNMC